MNMCQFLLIAGAYDNGEVDAMNDPTPQAQQPDPPRFRRFDEALYWLSDRGWRQVGASRGSHFRMEHPAFSRALFLIYHHGGVWTAYQQMQLVKHLRKLERDWRRAETG
jgi:hypothetical protein